MKKISVLTCILCLIFSSLSWAQTIDEVNVPDEPPYLVEVIGTYPDGCERVTERYTVISDGQAIIYIFTVPLSPTESCLNEPGASFLFREYIPDTIGDDPEVIVKMYEGTLQFDETGAVVETGTLLASNIPEENPSEEDPPDEEALEAYIDVRPEVININRHRMLVWAKIILPEGYMPEDVDTETIELGLTMEDGESWTVPAERSIIWRKKLFVKFDNRTVFDLIEENVYEFPAKVTFFIRGELLDGPFFVGTDDVKVIEPRRMCRFKKHFMKRWKSKGHHCR